MTTHVRFRGFFSLSILFLVLFPLAAFAAEPVGHMTANAAGISWQIGGDNESVSLTISGPNDFAYQHQFANAHSISLKVREIGNSLPDGSYIYELRVTPRISQGLRMQLANARATNDNSEIARLQAANGLNDSPVQSGAFAILNGSFVNSDNTEPGAPNKSASVSASRTDSGDGGDGGSVSAQVHKTPVRALDVVTADDAIIQGSACIGLDCVNNESFGFDTVRLKENNTRIKFDDTSTSSGFPNVDWQLTANDSASGGANKFSVEDITNTKVPFTITGNAPTNSIFVANTGKVGFGTSTPGLNLHITATDTPAIRQEQTNGGGFTAQTWDIGANEANWFVRDVTGGSRLPLRIRPGAPTSSIDISANGNVGIGTASPGQRLSVVDSTQVVQEFRVGSTIFGFIGSGSLNFSGAATTDFSIYGNFHPVKIGGRATADLVVDTTGNVGIGTTAPTSKLQVVGLSVFANNAAAVAGGLTAGALYRTGGDPDLVCVVH